MANQPKKNLNRDKYKFTMLGFIPTLLIFVGVILSTLSNLIHPTPGAQLMILSFLFPIAGLMYDAHRITKRNDEI